MGPVRAYGTGRDLGLHVLPCGQLASSHVAIPHGGRRSVRHASGWTSRHESDVPHPRQRAGLRPLPEDDEGPLAQRCRGGAVRGAPDARGIRRLGRRAEGRSQHALLAPDDLGVCALRRRHVLMAMVRRDRGRVHPGAHGEADAGDPSVRPAALGLLAPRSVRPETAVVAGEAPSGGSQRGLERRDVCRTDKRRGHAGLSERAAFVPHLQHARLLCLVPLLADLAPRPRRLLPLPFRRPTARSRAGRVGLARDDHVARGPRGTTAPLPDDRMALVPGHDDPCDRTRPGWRPVHGRPVFLCAVHRTVHHDRVEPGGRVPQPPRSCS